MKPGGYAGNILFVDLGTQNIQKKPLDRTFAGEYIGGLGFGAKIYLDLLPKNPDIDPFAPENPFVLMTGPLTGIRMHAVARWTVGTRSPLTGFWGDANVGGFFGAELKFAGYDGIVITGASEKPVYLFIDDEKVEIRDAGDFWGLDTYDLTDRMVDRFSGDNRKKGQVLGIGPAGEKLVRFASLINHKGHAAGRTGMGAVWGAKRLKAIFVRGNGKIPVAHPERLKALRSELKEVYDNSIAIEGLRAFGTVSHIDLGVIAGDIPIKNWQMNEWDEIDEIGPIAYEEKILTRNRTCHACGVMCKREAEVKEGPFRFKKGPGPEYETVASFGSMCLNKNIEAIGKANEICNRFGMDTISCGSTIAFAMECFEKGLIDETDTDGIRLSWGNAEAIVEMTEKIGRMEGFGAILAEGSARAAKRIGKGSDKFLATVKGLEAPMHDPRAAHGYGLAYAVSPRGACHNASLQYPIESGAMFLPEFEETAAELVEQSSENKAALNVIAQDFGMFFSSCAVFCNLGAMVLNATQAVAMVNHVTGFEYSIDDVVRIGRKIWYLKRGLSNLFGDRSEQERLPERLLVSRKSGPTAGSVPDMERMLGEFYEIRGINPDGIPKKEVLEANGLTGLAERLFPSQ